MSTTFDRWWNEVENFGTRGERLLDVLDKASLAQVAFDEGKAAALRAGQEAQEPDIVSYVKGIYGYLESTAPDGVAVEAFRLPPSPTRAQSALFDAASSDADGINARPARQDSADRREDRGSVESAPEWMPKVRRFIDLAAGEGLSFEGIDAADLYISIWGDEPSPEIDQLINPSIPKG